MNISCQKKAWKRPQLTVLVRIDIAESVLAGCKLATPSRGADSLQNQCGASWFGFCNGTCSHESVS